MAAMAKKTSAILLIEDDPDNIAVIQKRLMPQSGFSFKIESVTTLKTGLRKLDQKEFDIILLDLALPDSQGLETFDQIHAHASKTPIVILTGNANHPVALEAIHRGAQDYLIKGSFDGEILARTLSYAIERHEIQSKLVSATPDLQTANARLAMLTLLDPLTELYNRRGLQHVLSREIHRSQREGMTPVVLLIDLDDFKRINDSLGHAVGDVILKEVAQRIQASLRGADYVGRIGGDEFMVLLPQTRLAEGLRIAERVRLAISTAVITLSSGPVKVTGSLGMVLASRETPSVDELVSQSQFALHKSKEMGKNRVYCNGPTDKDDTPEEFEAQVMLKLRSGDYLRAMKQPIFDLRKGTESGYEFLSRLALEGFEMPDHFFRFCLEPNMLTLVDHQCLKVCLAAAHDLAPHLVRHFNLFPSTLIGIPTKDILAAFPSNLGNGTYCIEISEQQIIGNPSYLIPVVQELKQAGIQIAIDDVGFGHSCLESLIVLEPDIVKIDKKFIDGLGSKGSQVQSLKRLLKVTESLGAKTIAEGIELPEDLAVLKELGVPYGQGYLLGRPTNAPIAISNFSKQK